LCVTDGTAAGTLYLADIGSGSIAATIPAQDFMYIITNRLASFSPFAYEAQIWKSNGTALGTSLVYTMPQAGISNSCIWTSDRDIRRNFSVSGNSMFFNGYDPANGNELWVTQGTALSTHIVKDINSGTGSSSPFAFCKIGNDVFFTAIESSGRKLWKTDGANAGTLQIPVAEPFFILDNAVGIVNNKMIFYAHNTIDGYEPYVSDGTAAGTFMLKNINGAGNSWISQSQNAHLRFNSKYCFFVANNGTANALWRTDGTSSGTIQLTTDAQAAFSGVSGGSYTDIDETGLWLMQYNSSGSGNNEKLYRSDGTAAGTYLVTTGLSFAQYVKIYKGALWMASRNIGSPANTEPWRSGGNAATTNRAFEIAPGNSGSPSFTPISSNPFGFFVKNNKLYFFASSTAAPDRNLYQYTGDFTFNGSVAGGLWKDSANWNGLLPPGITDSVFINTGTPNALNITAGTAYAGTLLLQNNAVISITNSTDSLIVNNRIANSINNSVTGSGVLSLKNISGDTVQINNGLSVSNLAIQSAANLIANNLTVNSNLNLTGNNQLLINNNSITLSGSTSTITQTGTSYINTNGSGKLIIESIGATGRTGAVTFPVGTAANYNPVEFSNTGTVDNFSVRVQPQIFQNFTGETGTGAAYTNNAVNNTWLITEAVSGGTIADISLQWNAGQELPGFNRAISQFGHYTGSWQLGAVTGATGTNPYILNGTGITSLSPFGIFNNNGILPLRFISLNAQQCNATVVCLNWTTANEVNVSHFEIERSENGRVFTSIRNLQAGNLTANSYTVTDDISALLSKTAMYYRLKQVDKDGKLNYSNITVIRLSPYQQVSIYPVPATDKINITGFENARVIQLFDVHGKNIVSTAASSSIDVSKLAKGMYVMKVLLKSGSITKLKFIKL
jgi:ELWxxDGT repeat protein